jgi:DNA-binding beta-propeller fold protein YncE
LAIDGNSNVWVANDTGTTVSEFNNSGSPMSGSSGYSLGIGSGTENGIAVDGSGNVWVANSRSAPQLVELVGAAAPVVTPLAAGVANNKLGTLP